MIKLFVGLGNPGPDYEATRHNAGFWWIDALARELKVNLVPERSYYGLAGRTSVNGQSVWLLQPQTFMNLSGKSVASLARFFKIQPEEILVVHDELDLPPGRSNSSAAAATRGTTGCVISTPSWVRPITGACALALDTPAKNQKLPTGCSKNPRPTSAR